MEETRNIDLTSLDIPDMLSQIQHILTSGQNNHVQLSIIKRKPIEPAFRQNLNILNYNLTLQQHDQLKITRPLSSLMRTSNADSLKHLMKMSNRMGSYVARQMETADSLFLISEEGQLKPKSVFEGQLNRGQIFYEQKQYEISIDMFKSIQAEELMEAERALLSLNLGNCYFRTKRYAEAIETYTCEDFPNENQKQKGQRHSNLASCFAKLKKYELSLKAYNEAVKIYAKYPDIDCSNLLNNVGIIYMNVKMFKSAEKYFMNSIEERKLKSPASVDLLCFSYTKLAICQGSDGRYEQAMENLLIALNWAERGEGDLELVLKELASCCQKLKRWSEALEYYEKLSYSSKSQGFILEKVCLIHRELGHKHEFEKFLKQALGEYKKEFNERKISELNNIARANGIIQVTISRND